MLEPAMLAKQFKLVHLLHRIVSENIFSATVKPQQDYNNDMKNHITPMSPNSLKR